VNELISINRGTDNKHVGKFKPPLVVTLNETGV
jgi:hypothetical protein